MAIKWDYDKMTTGVDEIDAEHQEWIRRFNEFDSAINKDEGQTALRSALSFYLDYTASHFAHEETYMARYQCPAAEANRLAHLAFKTHVAETDAWVKQEGASLFEVVTLRLMLEEWMTNHICTIDVQLRDAVTGPLDSAV
jgi:hemerythrin-like metal-binding protein